jgi:hypothetical protein
MKHGAAGRNALGEREDRLLVPASRMSPVAGGR